MTLFNEKQTDYNAVIEPFDGHYKYTTLSMIEPISINTTKKSESLLKTLQQYINWLTLYGTLFDVMTQDRIIVGIHDAKLSEKLKLKPELDQNRIELQLLCK